METRCNRKTKDMTDKRNQNRNDRWPEEDGKRKTEDRDRQQTDGRQMTEDGWPDRKQRQITEIETDRRWKTVVDQTEDRRHRQTTETDNRRQTRQKTKTDNRRQKTRQETNDKFYCFVPQLFPRFVWWNNLFMKINVFIYSNSIKPKP